MSDELMAVARQGQPQAIQTFLNQTLSELGLNVAGISYQPGCMQLMLEVPELPEQASMVEFLREQIAALQIPNVMRLHVYCRCAGEAFPSWDQEVAIYNDAQTHWQMAQQGNTESIKALIAPSFAPQGVSLAEVALQGNCLHIVLESAMPPDQASTVEFLRQCVVKLQSPNIAMLQVYARQPGSQFPNWTQQTPVHIQQQVQQQQAPPPQPVQQQVHVHVGQPQAQPDGLTCFNCGSSAVHTQKQGFGFGKAAIGAALTLNPLGLLAGGINKNKIQLKCLKCGYKWEV